MGIFNTTDPAYARTYAEEAAMVDASELIASALEHSGMTRTELADALGVNKSEITARLKGERNITVRNLAKTLHELGARLSLNIETKQTERMNDHNVTYLQHYIARRTLKSHSAPVPASARKAAFAGMR